MGMVNLTNFDEQMKKRVTEIKSIIQKYLPQEEGFQRTLLEAVNYSMLVGGKKLRPLLMQQTYVMFGGKSAVIQPFMAAIEMIHTHSLIHDDLPAMDNDEYRRGKKTTHIVYGEAMAILAGDALLNLAYETASKAFDMEPGNPYIGKAIQVLSGKTGLDGMIGGQSVDVEYVDRPLTAEQLYFIYSLKTGALIEASMMIGAILAGASDEEIEKVQMAARNVGLAFQIQDDILDVTGEQETLGKPVKSDEKNNKTTYVTVNGLEKAKQDVAFYSREAIRLLDELPYENEFLDELILNLIHRNT
ncbi:MAG TPA: polyprenyl synthetase family protein [Candidatus Choladousia intestinipullorum]|nr:polyprenyl synthetase family protein [Candidatus Choladousia intestinipullorum]